MGEGVLVGVDDVVEEVDCVFDGGGEAFPFGFAVFDEFGDVDAAEVAGLVGVEWLFSAGVG